MFFLCYFVLFYLYKSSWVWCYNYYHLLTTNKMQLFHPSIGFTGIYWLALTFIMVINLVHNFLWWVWVLIFIITHPSLLNTGVDMRPPRFNQWGMVYNVWHAHWSTRHSPCQIIHHLTCGSLWLVYLNWFLNISEQLLAYGKSSRTTCCIFYWTGCNFKNAHLFLI